MSQVSNQSISSPRQKNITEESSSWLELKSAGNKRNQSVVFTKVNQPSNEKSILVSNGKHCSQEEEEDWLLRNIKIDSTDVKYSIDNWITLNTSARLTHKIKHFYVNDRKLIWKCLSNKLRCYCIAYVTMEHNTVHVASIKLFLEL